jgi:hypothetical protein
MGTRCALGNTTRSSATPQAKWYALTAAHNTVVVDGKDHHTNAPAPVAGRITLWAKGRWFRVMRASGTEMTGGHRFERTVVMVDISERDCYLLDIIRVVGGQDHAKFFS